MNYILRYKLPHQRMGIPEFSKPILHQCAWQAWYSYGKIPHFILRRPRPAVDEDLRLMMLMIKEALVFIYYII